MRKTSFRVLTTFALLFLAFCGAARAQLGPFSYAHITTTTTTNVKNGAGILAAVCVNTVANTGTITVYDSTTGAGTVIAVITMVTGQSPACVTYAARVLNGITVVTATAAGDVTVSFQ